MLHAPLHVGIEGAAHRRGCCALPKIISAVSAASCRPASEAPACTMTGQPWIGRATLSGPRTDKNSPLWFSDVQPLRIEKDASLHIANERVVRPAIPQPGHDVEELARATIALACSTCSSRPKFIAASGLEVVTTFQPARPPLMWSSEANFRATWYGSL